MVDEDCAAAVRSGLLVAALASTGVEAVELGAAVAVPEALGFSASPREARPAEPTARPELHVVPDPDADRKAIAAARERLEETEQAVARATEALTAAATDVADLEARGLQVQGELDELRRRLAELEASVEEVDDELADAEEVRAEAEAALAAAAKDHDAAAAALARLDPEAVGRPSPSTGHGLDPAGVAGVGAGPVGLRVEAAVELPGLAEVVGRGPDAGAEPGEEGRAQRRRLHDPRTLDRHPDLVGLELAQQVVGAGTAVHPDEVVSPRPNSGIVSSTSRTSKAIASRVARTTWARVVPRVRPMISAPRVRVPVRGAEPGQRRHEDDARGVRHRRGDRRGLGRRPDDLEPVAQPLHGRAGHEDRALQGVGQLPVRRAPRRRGQQPRVGADQRRSRCW